MRFKEGDIVECINPIGYLEQGVLYEVSKAFKDEAGDDRVFLKDKNNKLGWYPGRFVIHKQSIIKRILDAV